MRRIEKESSVKIPLYIERGFPPKKTRKWFTFVAMIWLLYIERDSYFLSMAIVGKVYGFHSRIWGGFKSIVP